MVRTRRALTPSSSAGTPSRRLRTCGRTASPPPQPHTAVAEHGPAELLVLHKSQYESFCRDHPAFATAVRELAGQRIQENQRQVDEATLAKQEWATLAISALRSSGNEIPTASDLSSMKEEHNNAGMAIVRPFALQLGTNGVLRNSDFLRVQDGTVISGAGVFETSGSGTTYFERMLGQIRIDFVNAGWLIPKSKIINRKS